MRPVFWRVWLRITLIAQAVTVFILGVGVLERWGNGKPSFFDDWNGLVPAFVAMTLVSVGVSVFDWWNSSVQASKLGIYIPPRPREGAKSIEWEAVELVQRQRHFLSGRTLRVVSKQGTELRITERVADLSGFCEAVVHFAGEAHPLARALNEIAEEG